MTEHFFTWGDLVTYGGAVMAVLIITEFTKDLPGIRKIPPGSGRIWWRSCCWCRRPSSPRTPFAPRTSCCAWSTGSWWPWQRWAAFTAFRNS